MRLKGFTPQVIFLWIVAVFVAFGLATWELFNTDSGRRALENRPRRRDASTVVEFEVEGDAREP